MARKPTYEELEQKVKELEKESVERNRAEEALRSEKNKLQALMDGLDRTQIGIDIVGTDYKILFQNQTLKERFGDLTGKLCYAKYMGLEKPCDFCPMIEAIKSGKVESVQLTGTDGRDYELFSTSLPDPDGTVDKAIEVVLDTTERKHAEKALRESEAQKKAILDGSIDRIRLVDKDMRIIWANKTTARELNIAPEDLVGQLCYEGLIGKDTPCPECPTKKARESGNIEHAILHQPKSKGIKGETYWDSYAVPIKDESGDIVNMIQVARNITEAKRAEEALRESEEKHKTLAENSLTGIFILQHGRYVFVNDRFAQIHGYKPEEMYEKYHLEFIHPDERDVTSRRLNGEAVPQRYEVRRLRKDGKTVWCEMMAAHIQHRGKPATMGNIIDINERKRAEETLRESELWMRNMFNSMEEAVFIVTPDRAIVDINEAGTRMFGYSKDELMNRSTEILHVDHEHYLEFGGRMKEAFDKGQAARFEFDMKRKSGEIFPSERTISLLKD